MLRRVRDATDALYVYYLPFPEEIFLQFHPKMLVAIFIE